MISLTERLLELADKATPGPWVYRGERHAVLGFPQVSGGPNEGWWVCVTPFPDPSPDAAFIAALSPEVVRALCEAVEALDSERVKEIADILDFFDRVLELEDSLLPGETEGYRAADHHAMQDDLRRLSAALARLNELAKEERA